MAGDDAYYSVSTLAVKPENVNKVVEFFTRVSKATQEQEPAAQIYRWYKVEGQDEFLFIEKFASEKDYRAHQNSAHVQGLYKEYLAHITEPLSSIPLIHPRTDWWVVSRGLEQHNTDLHTYLLDAPGWE